MRVVIDAALFGSSDSADLHVLRVLLNAVDRPHQILISAGEAGRGAFIRWLGGHRAEVATALRTLVERGESPEFARLPPGRVLTVSEALPERVDRSGRTAVARPGRAATLVQEPLILLLENGRNDKAFLQTAMPPGALRDWFARAVRERWVEFRSPGGITECSNWLEAADDWHRFKVWVMCDAETWHPDQVHKHVANLRRAASGEPVVPLTILERRAIENYLPMEALEAWGKRVRPQLRAQVQAGAEAVLALNAAPADFNLRHFYHFERGFRADKLNIPSDYSDFLADSALQDGLGKSIKDIWLDNRESQQPWMEDAWFARDGQRDEMQRLVASIRARL